jgi:hypothetical protein
MVVFFILSIFLFSWITVVTGQTANTTESANVTAPDPAKTIFYEKLNISDHVHKIRCKPSDKCPDTLLHNFVLARSVMVDNERKILMEYTPKAGCTSAVTMFLADMGFRKNKEYHMWPHAFREEYFYKRCGTATPCMFESKYWYRFKIVRNPYDRAVSSFIHIMTYAGLRAKVVPPERFDNFTYEEFLDHLLTLTPHVLQGLAGGHVSYQSQPYERMFFGTNVTVFHTIVKSENLAEGLAKVNKDTGAHFQIADKGSHLAHRHDETNYFVGNMSWELLKDRIPTDYGHFYNHRIKDKTLQVFSWDIRMYKYNYPFKTLHP